MTWCYILGGGLLGGWIVGKTAAICLRFSKWLIPLVLAWDFLGFFTANIPGVIIAHVAFLYLAAAWDPVRGMYLLPRWPRAPRVRGARKPRRRRIAQPMAWDRGPLSY